MAKRKTTGISFLLILALIQINCSSKKPVAVIPKNEVSNSSVFKHPGILNSKQQLAFVKEKIKANQEPWKTAFKQLKDAPFSSLSYQAKPYEVVDCGSFNKPNVGCDQEAQDGMAVYCLSLMYYFTDDEKYAGKAVEIIDAWCNTYQKNTSSNARLMVSWTAPWFVNGAEILKYNYLKWDKKTDDEFNGLLDKFLPYVMDETMPGNNWIQSAIEANMAIAVFKDDKVLFDKAVERWKFRVKTYIYQKSDGDKPINTLGKTDEQMEKTWRQNAANTAYVDGVAMETCRDLGHLNLGFSSMVYAAEIAYQQNVDLFSLEKKRLSDFMELHGSWMTGEKPVPANICDGFVVAKLNDKKGVEPPTGGGQTTWEIAYNHLHGRLNIPLPYTKEMLNKTRPAKISKWVAKGETLTHAGRIF